MEERTEIVLYVSIPTSPTAYSDFQRGIDPVMKAANAEHVWMGVRRVGSPEAQDVLRKALNHAWEFAGDIERSRKESIARAISASKENSETESR